MVGLHIRSKLREDANHLLTDIVRHPPKKVTYRAIYMISVAEFDCFDLVHMLNN
jgi:hypothetical protein